MYVLKPRKLKFLPRLKQKAIKQILEVQEPQYAHFLRVYFPLKTIVRILSQFFVT